MTGQSLQLETKKQLLTSSKAKQIGISLSRLAVTTIVTFGVGAFSIFDRYNTYWNKTIFRVQTVDFNILSHTLPTKLSYAIINNQPEEIQRTLDSNYNLFGLVVTDPSGQKVIASSGKGNTDKSWLATLNSQQLQSNSYDLLLDPPPLFPQWSYESPRALERSATNLTNQGRVIGRVYYVRGGKPLFQEDFSKWLSNPFSGSSRAEIYTMTMLACLGGGFAFWSLWEYLLYKKRVQQEKAKEREQTLIQQNQTLELQLTERISQLQQLQEQWRIEQLDSIKQAEELRSNNHQLQQEISQLRETMKILPAVANSQSTQVELDRTKEEAESARQRQQQQEEEIKKLNHQLHVYQEQISEVKQKGTEFKKLQQQIEEVKMARSQAESEMEKLRSSERHSRTAITNLEERLLREQNIQQQLAKQLEILQQSLAESQQREQESRLKAERASEQMQVLADEMEIIREDMGRHDLNKFEKSIQSSLQLGLSDKKIIPQYDAGNQSSNSKFIDFVVTMNNCIIAIEAKSYEGVIEPVGSARNTNWICRKKSNRVRVNACWGLNPYQQVKTYVDSLLQRPKFCNAVLTFQPIVYGVVVFPSRAEISSTITDNIGGYFRVTTLDKLPEIIKSLEAEAQSRNRNRTTYLDLERYLTEGYDAQLAA